MHLSSLCQTWLNLKTHTVSETENRTLCLTTLVRQSALARDAHRAPQRRAGTFIGRSSVQQRRSQECSSVQQRRSQGASTWDRDVHRAITVSSCQSDISNQCRIKTPCITGMAEKGRGAGGGRVATIADPGPSYGPTPTDICGNSGMPQWLWSMTRVA